MNSKSLSFTSRQLRAAALIRPAQQHPARGISGANGGQQHQVPFSKTPLLYGVAQTERNRPAGGVSVLVDIHHHLRVLYAKALLHRPDDPQIRLMRHH